jgi:hypothetical protein
MDEDFAYFMKKMGPPLEKRQVPPSTIEHYRGKLPDQLLAYWREHGWSGYADGLFWTVDPQEYEPVLEAWIGETTFMEQDAYHIIARGAFGEIYFWGENTGASIQIFAPGSFCMPALITNVGDDLDFEMRLFFSAKSRDEDDFEGLFGPALKQLGSLKHDEMYGFVPALALGGRSSLEHLQKVKAVEHLILLAQLAPLDVITYPSQI